MIDVEINVRTVQRSAHVQLGYEQILRHILTGVAKIIKGEGVVNNHNRVTVTYSWRNLKFQKIKL